jgi:hypothetical protein
MQTITAKWFHPGRRKDIRLIVVHCTVSPEQGTGAEAVANYFKAGTRKASTHRVADNNSTVQCVPDTDTAFGAAGANSDGLHLELVGYPTQTRAEWLDTYSHAELVEAAATMREWSDRYRIPHRWLTVPEVANGTARGFCTHKDVSDAFPAVSTGHWDPGPGFPKDTAFDIWFPPAPPAQQEKLTMFIWKIVDQPGKFFLQMPDGLVRISEEQAFRYGHGAVPHVEATDADFRHAYQGPRVVSFNDPPKMEEH